MAGNEVAPFGMNTGCPLSWTLSDVLEIDQWIELGCSYGLWFAVEDSPSTESVDRARMFLWLMVCGGGLSINRILSKSAIGDALVTMIF